MGIQSSKQYETFVLHGEDRGSLEAADLTVAYQPTKTAPDTGDTWYDVDAYDPDTGELLVLVGPGSTIGELPLGLTYWYLRFAANPEIPVLYMGTVNVTAG